MNVAPRSDLIFDVGFHVGQDAAFYLAKGFRVVAFEASPRLAEAGSARFAAAAAAGRFTMITGAIIRPTEWEAGTRAVRFYGSDTHDEWGTANSAWAADNERVGAKITESIVPAVDLTARLREFGIPHYMKIDIEGLDIACLEALQQVGGRPSCLSIEVDRLHPTATNAAIDLLVDLGYRSFQLVQQSRVPWQRVPVPPREGGQASHRFALGATGLFGAELPADRWLDRSQLGAALERVAGLERLWGPGTLIRSVPGAWRVLWALESRFGLPLPGWYDIHARSAAP